MGCIGQGNYAIYLNSISAYIKEFIFVNDIFQNTDMIKMRWNL